MIGTHKDTSETLYDPHTIQTAMRKEKKDHALRAPVIETDVYSLTDDFPDPEEALGPFQAWASSAPRKTASEKPAKTTSTSSSNWQGYKRSLPWTTVGGSSETPPLPSTQNWAPSEAQRQGDPGHPRVRWHPFQLKNQNTSPKASSDLADATRTQSPWKGSSLFVW